MHYKQTTHINFLSLVKNSKMAFISKAYTGKHIQYLYSTYIDLLPRCDNIMADNGLNVFYGCTTIWVNYTVPSGMTGASQITLNEIISTVAKGTVSLEKW